jgi:hypothetical protein
MIDATPLLRVYGHFRLARLARQIPAEVQEQQLLRLVRHAAGTRFGRAHQFDRINSVADFQRQVPLRGYDDFWRDYLAPSFPNVVDAAWPGRIPYFALTSGTTTGRTKYIPVTAEMCRSNRRAAIDLLVHHCANRPHSRIMSGRNFMLGGSTALHQDAPGTNSGDLSGIAAADVPWWARPYYFPPRALALIEDWERKVAILAERSLHERILSIAGTPSWLLLFFERLAALRPQAPRRLAAFYPHLEMLVHGGVSFAPYRDRFAAWLEGGHAELREVYPASEGFIALADRGPGDGLRMLLDIGLFFEFIPVEELGAAAPRRHWIADARTGVDYALAISSCAGLWAYMLGDVVRLIDRDPPRLLVIGRTSYFLSAYGEHLTGEEIEQAVLEAAGAIGRQVTDFSVGAAPASHDTPQGRHVFVVEFSGGEFSGGPPEPETLARFAADIDAALSRRNDDYRAHRTGGQMLPPRVLAVPAGGFAAWMKARGRLGGQNKVPRVINDAALLGALLEFFDVAPPSVSQNFSRSVP